MKGGDNQDVILRFADAAVWAASWQRQVAVCDSGMEKLN